MTRKFNNKRTIWGEDGNTEVVRKVRKVIRSDVADAITFLNKMDVPWCDETDGGIIALAVVTRLRLRAERGRA